MYTLTPYDGLLLGVRNGSIANDVVATNMSMNESEAIELADAFRDNKTIPKVWINGNPMGDKAMIAMAEAFKTMPALEEVKVHDTGMGAGGLKALLEAFEGRDVKTCFALLYNNPLGDEGAEILAQALQKNPALTNVLKLDNTQIGDKGIIALAKALEGNNNVRRLMLDKNEITDKGAFALAEMLRKNRSIRKLELDGNQIGNEGLMAIGEVFLQNNQLASLTFNGNPIDRAGEMALEKKLIGKAKNLTYVNGCGNTLLQWSKRNYNIAQKLQRKIGGNLDELPFVDCCEAYERLPTIRTFERRRKVRKTSEAFGAYIETLPELAIDGQLTLQTILQTDNMGKAPFDNPKTWMQFPAIVDQLHENGIRLQENALLNADNSASPLLERAVELGKADLLFSEENWKGGNSQALKAVLRLLPEKTRDSLSNLHQLQATVSGRTKQAQAR